MIRCVLAALAIAFAMPAHAQDSRPYDEAVAARLAGDPARAERLLEPWVDAHPEDLDARLQLAYARLALGRLSQAEGDFQYVLARAPEYEDARRGLALVAERRAAGSESRGYVFVEGALSNLSTGADDWKEIAAGGVMPVGPASTANFRIARFRRFGVDDTEFEAGAVVRPSDDVWLRFGGSATPSANFRPEWGVSTGLDYRIASGPNATVAGIDLRYRSYPAQDVFSIEPQITQYFADGRFSVTVRGTGTLVDGDGLLLGGILRGDFAPGERTRVFAGAGTGPDSELGVVTDTTSVFAGGEIPLNDRLSLTASANREWRSDGIDRTEGRLGLKIGL